MLQTITIHRHGGHSDEIDADVVGDFAVHEYIPTWLWKMQGESKWRDPQWFWTVSHVPSGRFCLHTRTRRAALAARRAFVGSGIPWDFAEPGAMTAEQREMGRTIKREWEGR